MALKKHITTSNTTQMVKIPGYDIKGVLGRGGMSTVYLATQKTIGRDVALKVLATDFTDEEFSKRFLREAQIISKLSHPNIITIFDADIYKGCHYMTMEYIPGKNFSEARDDLNRLQKLIIITQMAQALEFARIKGYVHRDIKPENILLNADGRAILTDFGIAKSMDIAKGLTETGKILGTPHFMSPEQGKGLKVDHRSDIYSLGVVLFQALTGRVPYDGKSFVEVCMKHMQEEIPKLPAGLEILQPIIDNCLAKNPNQRYQVAQHLVDELKKIPKAITETLKNGPAKKSKKGQPFAKTEIISGNGVAKNEYRSKKQLKQDKQRASRSGPARDSYEYKCYRERRRKVLTVILLCASLAAIGYFWNEISLYWNTVVLPFIDKNNWGQSKISNFLQFFRF